MNHLRAPFSLQYKDSCVISTIFQQYYEQSYPTLWESRPGALIQSIMQLRGGRTNSPAEGCQWTGRKCKGKVGKVLHPSSSFQSNCWSTLPPCLCMPILLGSVPTWGNLKTWLELESMFHTFENVYPPSWMIEKNLNQILLESKKKKKKRVFLVTSTGLDRSPKEQSHMQQKV